MFGKSLGKKLDTFSTHLRKLSNWFLYFVTFVHLCNGAISLTLVYTIWLSKYRFLLRSYTEKSKQVTIILILAKANFTDNPKLSYILKWEITAKVLKLPAAGCYFEPWYEIFVVKKSIGRTFQSLKLGSDIRTPHGELRMVLWFYTWYYSMVLQYGTMVLHLYRHGTTVLHLYRHGTMVLHLYRHGTTVCM